MSAQFDNLSRKEREFQQREQLILDTAQNMLHEHGYAQLTMDRIAEAVEYSKGTIYNHFSSKEDLVCSLCCRCVSNLIELFKRAYDYPGTTRERFAAIGIAYSLYHQLNPLDAQNMTPDRLQEKRYCDCGGGRSRGDTSTQPAPLPPRTLAGENNG